MSDFKVLGKTVEEFNIHWNMATFRLGGLSERASRKIAQIYVKELSASLQSNGTTLQDFFINLTRGGSLSTMAVAEATTYDKIKDFYRQNLWGSSIPYTLPIALDMSPPIKGKNVLDIGCGFGRLSLLCALKQARRVVAIDLSDPLIQTLERTADALNLTNIEAIIMDAEELKLDRDSFDVIFCCEVIEHLPHPAKTLRSIHRLLKPTGTLILSTPNELNFVGFKQKFFKWFGYDWISPYGTGQPELHIFSPMSLRALLSSCKLKITAIRGAELLDNLAIFYPGGIAVGILQFFPLLFPIFQKLKDKLVRLGRTSLLNHFGLELFCRAKRIG